MRTGEETVLTKLIVAFRNFAKAAKQQIRLFYIRPQCLGRSKHSSLRLYKICVWMCWKARDAVFFF